MCTPLFAVTPTPSPTRLLNGITTADIIFSFSVSTTSSSIPPRSNSKANRGRTSLLVPGEEVTAAVHTTAMNIRRLVPWGFKDNNRSKVLQNRVDETRKAGLSRFSTTRFGADISMPMRFTRLKPPCSSSTMPILALRIFALPIHLPPSNFGTHCLKKE